MQKNTYKIVLLGEGRVGKTSLTLRYVNGEYSDRQQTTIQASFLNKRVTVSDQTIDLAIWDTAGQERFHALGPIYYRDADGALLVYDITDNESFQKVKQWVKELRKMVGSDISIAVAGNKIDLEKNRQVELDEATQYADSVKATHFQTSAKQNRGIDEVFTHLAKKILERKRAAGGGRAAPARGTSRIQVVADTESANKGGCC